MAQRERVRSASRIEPLGIAAGMLAAAVVYVSYHPSDSVSVEKGSALWFTALAIAIATIVWGTAGAARRVGKRQTPLPSSPNSVLNLGESDTPSQGATGRLRVAPSGPCCHGQAVVNQWADRLLDLLPWALAAWVMVAALATSPPGNLRMATNEAWVWVAGAAIFTAARRLLLFTENRRVMLGLILVCASALAVHGLHQQLISLPNSRADYRRDPEAVLEMAGIEAPPGSAARMMFKNRLFDGGPTGTFALANSLAAVLAVGLVLSVGCLRFQWNDWTASARAAGIAAGALSAAALVTTRSRSGVLAALLGVGLVLVLGAIRHRGIVWRRGWVGAIAALLIIAGLVAAWFGGAEFVEQAPASLAFRFQYWRSTWDLVVEHPWFGAGPGNFQSIYERYRELSASEQIAEPHNFLFETLASGGFVALAILVVLLASGLYLVIRRIPQWGGRGERSTQLPFRSISNGVTGSGAGANSAAGADKILVAGHRRWIVWGAGLALLLVWLIGFAVGWIPDLTAHLFAVPVALVIALPLLSSRSVSPAQLPAVNSSVDENFLTAVSALVALLTHLLVAGGWTVPGVAIHIWILAAMVCPAVASWVAWMAGRGVVLVGNKRRESPIGWESFAAIAIGLVLLVTLRLVSLGPVERSAAAMSMARAEQSSGELNRSETALRRALQADPWGTEPALWLADLLRWKLVTSGDSPALRREWGRAIDELKRRAGENPAIYRAIARQQLHLYQRYGRSEDLQAAFETLESAVSWAPANQSLAAQLAVTAAAAGDKQRARQAARHAEQLSHLGHNIERSLKLQYILVAEHLGGIARQGPQQQPADRLLANHLKPAAVPEPDG